MSKKKTYLLQGFRLFVNTKGYSPSQSLNKKKICSFLAEITVDPGGKNEGFLVSDTGNHQLYDIVIDSSDISFEIRFGDHAICYSLYRIDDSWTGFCLSKEHTEIIEEKSIIRCLVTPIKGHLFDKPETLNGLPFIGEVKDWAQSYKWHLEGPNKDVSYSPKRGKSIRKCSNCFYRNYEGAKDSDCHCGENGDIAKISFGIPRNQFMSEQIDGKEVGYFCPHWTDPAAH